MIAFRDNLPLIQFANGEAVAFEREWLVRSLTRAAHTAGYPEWWLAEHVAESVTQFLRGQCGAPVLAEGRFTRAVKEVLEVIGYSEVAQHFSSARPCLRLSLAEIARSADAGYELAFFDLLGRKIRELVQARRCDFEFYGLDECVRLLRGRKCWSSECEALRREIISFARQQAAAVAGQENVAFAVG